MSKLDEFQLRGGLIQLKREESAPPGPPTVIQRIDGLPVRKLERIIASNFAQKATSHVCIGARSTASTGNLFAAIYPDMSSMRTALLVLKDLQDYFKLTDGGDEILKSCGLIFYEMFAHQDEFAKAYWNFAQLLHNLDSIHNLWPTTYSPDPLDATFEFCLFGRAIFTTTLHNSHVRVSRNFHAPTWVMNQLDQFDMLRKTGNFKRWQKAIRLADSNIDPSGTYNTILTDHGEGLSANQLPGSAVTPTPFHVSLTDVQRDAARKQLIEIAALEGCTAELEAWFASPV